MSIGVQNIFSGWEICGVKNPAGIKSFGAHLRQLRMDRNWSQQELADMANIAKTTVQRIEHGRLVVSLDVLISLSEALQITLPELVNFPFDNQNFHQVKQ